MKRKRRDSGKAVTLLRNVRDDVRKLDWEKLNDDGRTVLVAKADVLQIIQDWIEIAKRIRSPDLASLKRKEKI